MLTLKLWNALSERPYYAHPAAMLQRTVLPPTSAFTNLIALLVAVVLVYNLVRFPFLIFPVALHIFCLKLALQIAEFIASVTRLDRRDLLAVTAIGEFMLLFDICRLCRDNRGDKAARLQDMRMGRWILRFAVFTFILLCIGIVARAEDTYWGIAASCIFIAGIAVLLYVEYRQSMVLAMLIAMHAGISGGRFNARLLTLVGYMGVQLGVFGLLLFTPSLANFLRASGTISFNDISFVAAFGLLGTVFYVVREAVIISLWYWLQERINDDVPILESI